MLCYQADLLLQRCDTAVKVPTALYKLCGMANADDCYSAMLIPSMVGGINPFAQQAQTMTENGLNTTVTGGPNGCGGPQWLNDTTTSSNLAQLRELLLTLRGIC